MRVTVKILKTKNWLFAIRQMVLSSYIKFYSLLFISYESVSWPGYLIRKRQVRSFSLKHKYFLSKYLCNLASKDRYQKPKCKSAIYMYTTRLAYKAEIFYSNLPSILWYGNRKNIVLALNTWSLFRKLKFTINFIQPTHTIQLPIRKTTAMKTNCIKK